VGKISKAKKKKLGGGRGKIKFHKKNEISGKIFGKEARKKLSCKEKLRLRLIKGC
jgi:hypothetical protein